DPFMLGVASGYPQPDAVVLWTRLLPDQDGEDGPLPPSGIPVDWEIAADEQFTRVVRRGHVMALPELGHSVHVDCRGLGAGREYWYRFVAGGVRSPAGRTATAPPSDALPGRLRVALASCQHYEHGFYGAYRHMVADQPDLVLHVGDYIYETAAGNRGVRSHGTAECQTLDDYRARYALYRSDPDLQRAHASCPWLVTWDDHEVDNDYASDLPEDGGDPATFLLRRAAAYQAFYEHMPLPSAALLAPGEVSLYCERRWGRLASLWMLDTRQYRAPHACPKPGRRGGNRVSNCAELAQPGRHKLGEVQENWLGRRLEASDARWNLLAQGTLMTYVDEDPGQTETFWTDSWNGYPWARQRLLDLLARGVSNPVVLSGDSHAFVVGDLNAVPADPASPIVASEFVTTSISSNGLPQSWVDEWFAPNPNVHLARSDVRGYVRLDVEREGIAIDLIAMESVAERSSAARVLASYRVADGLPGPVAA
ncbi:MAG TPA: alkaline phosphatase D family protein, partial [Steroidobacteraceae bacterium]|nr:alkaline phosphatase D family protein [Steroidobacteraceae bacterium]